MRGKSARQAAMLTVVTPDALVPQHHPIRRIRPRVDRAMARLSPAFETGGDRQKCLTRYAGGNSEGRLVAVFPGMGQDGDKEGYDPRNGGAIWVDRPGEI